MTGKARGKEEEDTPKKEKKIQVILYITLDGYPASLGFPIMHRVHAICTQAIIAIT